MVAITQLTQNAPVISPPSVGVRTAAQSSEKAVTLPQPTPQEAGGKPVSEQEVQKVVEQANRELKARNSGPSETIGFGYEERLNQLFVQVKDTNTGEVIREIPSKDFIQHKLAMQEMIGLILDRQA